MRLFVGLVPDYVENMNKGTAFQRIPWYHCKMK